jgi:hypothetical protein
MSGDLLSRLGLLHTNCTSLTILGSGLCMLYHNFYCMFSCYLPLKEPGLRSVYRYKEVVKIGVTLRPTDRRPVRLGVLLLLEQVARCYIYLNGNYFLYFSRRTPSLTRGRVWNLRWNNASSISSYIATDGLLISSSWCRTLNGAHKQILTSLFDSYFFFSV